jgi:hypothetical protein
MTYDPQDLSKCRKSALGWRSPKLEDSIAVTRGEQLEASFPP